MLFVCTDKMMLYLGQWEIFPKRPLELKWRVCKTQNEHTNINSLYMHNSMTQKELGCQNIKYFGINLALIGRI